MVEAVQEAQNEFDTTQVIKQTCLKGHKLANYRGGFKRIATDSNVVIDRQQKMHCTIC